MQFTVASRARDIAGVPDAVAGLKPMGQRTRGTDYAGGVPARDARSTVWDVALGADLCIHRVDGNGHYFDEKIEIAQFRGGQLDVLECFAVVKRQVAVEADGFHGSPLVRCLGG